MAQNFVANYFLEDALQESETEKKKKKGENPKNRINENGNFFFSHLVASLKDVAGTNLASTFPPPSPLRFHVMQFQPRRSSLPLERGSRDSSTRSNIVCPPLCTSTRTIRPRLFHALFAE